jgi:hypothetical protein
MFYFKQIEVDTNICNELKTWCASNMQTNDVPFVLLNKNKFLEECTLFIAWTKEQELKVKFVAGIKVNAHNKQVETKTPHIDVMPDGTGNIALNFPIENCDNTYTLMYELVKGEKIINSLPDGTLYSKFSDNSEFKEVSKFYLNNPTFFNTSVPHKVINNTDANRLSLSIRFENNPKIY